MALILVARIPLDGAWPNMAWLVATESEVHTRMQHWRSDLLLRLARSCAAWLVGGLCLLAVSVGAPHAQTPDELTAGGVSYVTPFPPGDVYKLQVYGDSYAEGLLAGLSDLAKTLDRVDLPRKHRLIPALIRSEADEDIRTEEQSRDVFHIAIVMMGLSDRGSLRASGGTPVRFGSTAWREQYGQRFDRLLKALKRRNMAIYVVGGPPLRRADANSDGETINEVLLERTQGNGIRFIEVAENFTDENGNFTQFGPDINGNREKLRDGDGIGFTTAGNRKLASLIATELKRDLTIARAERAVPLAGSEVDQRRINPEKAAAQAWKSIVSKDAKDATKDGRTPAAAASAANFAAARAPSGQNDQKLETSRLTLKFAAANGREEIIAVDIVRPAIPAAVIALLTRKETAEATQPRFEMLAEDVGNGISVSTMVTALPDAAGQGGRRRGAGGLANYTAVWVKGERLPPKPGRADDFSWPRPAAVATQPVPEQPNTARAPAGTAPDARAVPPRGRPALPKG